MKASPEMSLTPQLRVDALSGHVIGAKGKPIGSKKRHGYVELWNGTRRVLAHRVMWEYVFGAIPDGFQVNHKNGIKTDNRLANLELVTARGNQLHAHTTGLKKALQGESCHGAKLTELDVIDIRQSDEKQSALAAKYGVHPSIISEVKARKRWAHVVEA